METKDEFENAESFFRGARKVLAFADGACSGNPGPGGWGAILLFSDGRVIELGGHSAQTTNNKMEMSALGVIFKHLGEESWQLRVMTDSKYLIQGLESWIHGWKKNGWKTKTGEDVANLDFWKRLDSLAFIRKKQGGYDLRYVKGHAGIPGNERVDQIAVAYSKKAEIYLYDGSYADYGIDLFQFGSSVYDAKVKAASGPKLKQPVYLSYVNRQLKRHATWKECEANVKGVPGAKFKKCTTENEIQETLNSWGVKQ